MKSKSIEIYNKHTAPISVDSTFEACRVLNVSTTTLRLRLKDHYMVNETGYRVRYKQETPQNEDGRCPNCEFEIETQYNYCPNCGHKLLSEVTDID